MSLRAWTGCDRWKETTAQESAVAQSSPTIWGVKTGFSVKLVFASRNVVRVRTKDCYRVLCETRQVHSGNLFYGKDGLW